MSELYHLPDHAEYVEGRLADLQAVRDQLTRTQHLKTVLNQDWIRSVADLIRRIGPDLRCTDPAFYLFGILHDEAPRSNLIERLDHAIGEVENLARRIRRLKPFQKSLQELRSPQQNQIRGAIFEFLVLADLVKLADNKDLEIDLYPTMLNGRNIEARLLIAHHWHNFEAKALGFSNHDVGMRSDASPVGVHSVDSMIKQIHDALKDKASQLSGTRMPEPNLVCLALGYNADSHSGPWGIQEFFQTPEGQTLSAVLLFGSFLCRQSPKLIRNATTSRPLASDEEQVLMKNPALPGGVSYNSSCA